jgi:MFS superfamily sulfate permease-like transporter
VVGLIFVLRSNYKRAVIVVHDANSYLFRLRKDVSFMNKAFIKNKLEEVPANASVLIDASRADFIDQDVVETIEDFMIHAPLKNIKVELKRSRVKAQGFTPELVLKSKDEELVRTHEKELKPAEA